MRLRFLLPCLLFATAAAAQPAPPFDLAQAMADPDWIGPPVEQAWWRWDGQAAQYTLKRAGGTTRDTWQQPIDGGVAAKSDAADRAALDAPNPVYDAGGARMAFVRNGDVFVRDLRSGALTQLSRSDGNESRLQWGSDGALVWRGGEAWYRWNGSVVAQAALPKAEAAPDAVPEKDSLREHQLRLMRTSPTTRRNARPRARRTRPGAAPTRPVRRRRCTWARTWTSSTLRSRRMAAG